MHFTTSILAFLILSAPLHASDAPIPYQYGVFTPSKVDNGKMVLVPWNSAEGRKRLQSSKYKEDFYQLASHYQPAINPVYSTVTSAVIVMNGLRLPKHTIKSDSELEIKQPKAFNNGAILPFPAYSQQTFLNDETDKIKDRKIILLKNVTPENENNKELFKPGLGLEDLQKILTTVYHAKADITYAQGDVKTGINNFRKRMKEIFNEPNTFVIANFKGIEFGAQNEGTMSPLVAYDAKSDSILILDTGGQKNPWYWVPVSSLYKAMNVPYNSGKNLRGYIEVSDPAL